MTSVIRLCFFAAYWWPDSNWKEQSIAFLVLGSLSFIPGSYVTYVTYCAYRGVQGYSFSQIPTHDE